jgi:hypothetical protein
VGHAEVEAVKAVTSVSFWRNLVGVAVVAV